MENKGHRLKKFLLAGILVVLLIPLLQQTMKFYESKPLKGAIIPKEKPYFTLHGWWEGTYQESYNDWHNENFGFRSDFVRLHNQLAFNIYGSAKANGVVIGKDNFLYELNYIKTYTGQDFIGYPAIEEMATRLKAVQDSLEKQNVTLVVCLAAGKASFYPEYIPDEFGKASDTTNYKVMSEYFTDKGVNLIDYNKWFMQMKGKTEFPLYPKTGIHWSRYGTLMAIDSFINYVEHKRNVDMPGVVWTKTLPSDSLQSPDDDIGEAMNLMWPIKPFTMGYPVYDFEDTTGKAKVSLMAVSDSYFWSMFDVGLGPRAFSDVDFYYYFKEVYHSNGSPMTTADPGAGLDAVTNHDVIMIMATEANLYSLGWGFINNAFDRFVAHRVVQPTDDLVQRYETEIRMNDVWMKDIRKKAEEKGIDVDSMIHLDAVYMADQARKK